MHAVCGLNFSSFPYKPIGGCTEVEEKLEDWNGLFPKSTCCQNALLVFLHALALEAVNSPTGDIFISKDSWNNCSGPFTLQPNMSAHNCGYDQFYRGSGQCSMLQLSNITTKVTEKCSLFSSSPFDYACGDCTSAVSGETDLLLDYLKVDKSDGNEKATCLVAVLSSVIANRMNGSSETGDFNRCLTALVEPEQVNYIRLNYHLAVALLAIILAMVGLSIIIILKRYVIRNRKKETKHIKDNGITPSCSALYRFSKMEIDNAINFFPEKKYLGRGSAGQVYKGMIPSGQPVAIKQLYQTNTSDSFVREIEGLSRVRHANLVCLFGCCFEDGKQYLVYEYCSKGNLAENLLRKDSVLTWELRVKILRDCAFALKYLHHHVDGCIVHRDIKLTNILLTQKMEPKLSDFGLARLIGVEESKVYTDVRGTIGYMDPEYMSNAKLTCASDIYSFGIVMLQLLSGQRVIELDLNARDQLIRKAKDVSMLRRPLTDFQDPHMCGDIVTTDFESILQIAVLCVASSGSGRPTIGVVCDELDKAYKNTMVEMAARRDKNLLEATPSKSPEVMQV
ncbi:putative receptor-like protein kinase [Dorcoceras hygrometricum]|uniref:Putative receptor-like protein kinase n=1 Tax=Dorcoceras hygrometricum TaxID=472368 RepID=A0A2Z7AQX6_9LAMI|nr:putative receptor-like protein kinase [Dorcoceras hygrometricum]